MTQASSAPTELRSRLAARIRLERHRRRWSQEDAAEAAGLSLAYYQRIEWAKVNVPLDTLCAIAASLGVDAADLLVPVDPADRIAAGVRVDRLFHLERSRPAQVARQRERAAHDRWHTARK